MKQLRFLLIGAMVVGHAPNAASLLLIASLFRSRRFRLIVHPFLKRSTYLPNNFFLP